MFAFITSSIRNRLTAIVIGAALVPVVIASVILGLITFNQVQASLTTEAFNKLSAVQKIKVNQVLSYLTEREDDMSALAETTATFREKVILKLEAVNELKSNEIAGLFKDWDEDVRDVASDPGVVQGIFELSSAFQELGSNYIRALYLNKADVDNADDGTTYSAAHVEQHVFFAGYTDIHGFEDVFLIDPAGNIVYSARKTDLFGTNLISGAYKDSNLAALYNNLLQAPANQSQVVDAALVIDHYAMFIGAPIYNGPAFVGILAYQLPIAEIDRVIQNRTGLTETAETFLVGKVGDAVELRSDRVIKEGKIGDPKPGTDSDKALSGLSGDEFRVGSTGVYEISVYLPLDVPGLNWGVITTESAVEVFSPQVAGETKDYFTRYVEVYGYHDLFLISPEGEIFYSVWKGKEFQTNILTGTYSDSNLAVLLKELAIVKEFEFEDFTYYEPDGAPAGFFGMPLLNNQNEVDLYVVVQVSIDQLNQILSESTGLGETGETYLLGPDQLWRNDSRFLAELGTNTTVINEQFKVDTVASRAALAGDSGQGLQTDYRGEQVLSVWSPVQVDAPDAVDLEGRTWALLAEIDEEEALAPANAIAGSIALIVGITILLIGFAAVFVGARFAVNFVNPIVALADSAAKVAEGNLNVETVVQSRDEIGVLAQSFNSMTAQLRDIIGSLETRIAERTHSLELASEVGRSVSQVRALDVMLKDAAELIRAQFDLYYVQVYLTNPGQTELILQAGTGSVGAELLGRGHKLPLNTGSINGRAAIERRAAIVADTAQSATFRPNPLLPETRSEMAVPLIVGDKVVGVLDLQSTVPNALNQEILSVFTALAGQIAIAVQNANLLAETDRARADVEKQAARLARANWADYQDAINRPEHLGFMFEQNQVTPLADDAAPFESKNALVEPIALTGEQIGALTIELDDAARTPQVEQLIGIVARQVAQQLENVRLLDAAERYRLEAEQVARRMTRQGWEQYFSNKQSKALSYMYDRNEVKAHQWAAEQNPAGGVSIPLKSRDEQIGNLAVLDLDPSDQAGLDLANAVATRLSDHIENLRLLEETQKGQMELNKRARQLAAVSQISAVSSRELDIQKMLATVVYMTQRQFGLYHAHVFTYNDLKKQLEIAACGWKEGDEHEGTHGTTTISVDQEQSIVARAARERQAVVVNDVRSDPGWLPNPMLPDTAAELAVPLVIGDQVLGVLDVQADHINAFNEEDISIQTTLAAQVATALQNARSFAQAQQQAEREAMLNAINQKIQSATTVEAVLQIAARELGHALGAPRTIAQLSMKDKK
jgi:methyl-accepting chemotaxis protein